MTNRIWTIGSITLIILLLAGGWFLGAQPFMAAAAAADSERASVEQQNAVHQASIAALAQENENLASIQADYAGMQKSIPGTTDSSAFIKGLDLLAADAGVQISGITVGAPTAYTVPASAAAAAAASAETSSPDPASTEAPAAPIAVGSVAVTNPLITPENFVGVQVGVTVTGEYDAVLSFVNGLQTGARLFLVTSFDSARNVEADSAGEVTAQIDGLIYVLKKS